MNYPPQPGSPYGGPDPYGRPHPQSGPGGFPPPPGAHPQGVYNPPGSEYPQNPPPQFGGYGFPPSHHAQGGYQQFGGHGSGGQRVPPSGFGAPRRSRKGLWTTLGIGVAFLVVAAVVITGFVSPGFFVKDNPEAIADKIITAIEEKDEAQARALTCPGSEEADPNLPGDVTARLTGPVREEGVKAFVPVEVRFSGTAVTGEFVLAEREGEWCVEAFASSTASTPGGDTRVPPPITPVPAPGQNAPGGGSTPGAGLLREVVAAINAGDHDGAVALLCPNSIDRPTVRGLIDDDVNASIVKLRLETDDYVSADLRGTRNGRAVGGTTTGGVANGKWCAQTFSMDR